MGSGSSSFSGHRDEDLVARGAAPNDVPKTKALVVGQFPDRLLEELKQRLGEPSPPETQRARFLVVEPQLIQQSVDSVAEGLLREEVLSACFSVGLHSGVGRRLDDGMAAVDEPPVRD